MQVMFPVVVFPLTAIALMSGPIAISWVGVGYTESITVVMLLSLCNLFAFVSYPCGSLLVAQERIKYLYFSNGLMPIIYWLGIRVMISCFDIYSFAIMKLSVFVLIGIFYIWYSVKFLQISIAEYIKKVFFPNIPGLVIVIALLSLVGNQFCDDKNMGHLFANAAIMGVVLLLAFSVTYLSSRVIREQVKDVLNKYKK